MPRPFVHRHFRRKCEYVRDIFDNCHLFLFKCHLFFNNQLLFSNKVPFILNTWHLLSDKLQRPGESVLADWQSEGVGLIAKRPLTARETASRCQRLTHPYPSGLEGLGFKPRSLRVQVLLCNLVLNHLLWTARRLKS